MRKFVCGIVAVGLTTVSAAYAAKHQRIESQWRDRTIVIDGDNGDWPGPLSELDDKHPIAAGVENDGQSLYLVLSTSDSAIRRQIMREGLIVWFDPSGGDKKHFGIKYPVGIASDEGGSRGREGRGWGGYSRPAEPSSSDPQDQPRPIEPPNRLEVYGPAKDDAHSLVLDAAPGISVKVGQVEGYFVYELKVPLAKTSETPYAIEAKAGSVVGLGLETPKVEHPQGREGGGGGGGMGGGMGGHGGGMGGRGGHGGYGGGGGGRHGEGYEAPPQIKLWAAVQLASH
jgi:hypothetical protein